MTEASLKKVGILVGSEKEWPDAFIAAVNGRDAGVTAEFVKLGGTSMDEAVPYDVIIDRVSQDIPYYRAYAKYAVVQGAYVINNPFIWSADSKFFGAALIRELGMNSPRTIVLPNKEINQDVSVDSFRNLIYPMDWEGIVNYVGVPAIFKDIYGGGRPAVYRVHNIDELIQRYDESDTRTMLLQQIITSNIHIHAFVIGQQDVLLLRFSRPDDGYLPEAITAEDPHYAELKQAALGLTRAYKYDVNMVEFVIDAQNEIFVINSTNPTPLINSSLMGESHFNQLVEMMADMAITRANNPPPMDSLLTLLPADE